MLKFLRLFLALLTLFLLIVACNALPSGEARVRTELVTVVVVWSPTPDPNLTPQIIVVTATPDRRQVNVPDNLVPVTGGQTASTAVLTGDNLTPIGETSTSLSQNLPENCIVHVMADGDTIFGVALQYDVDGFLVMQINGLTEETATQMQIGDELLIPLEGCPLDQLPAVPTDTPIPSDTPEVSPTPTTPPTTIEPTSEFSPTPTVTATLTLPPTATDAQVQIAGLVSMGDVTAEGVRIVNPGSIIRIDAWKLTDSNGNEYIFGEQILFSNSELTLFTRAGQDTPIARYWGLETPVWEIGDVVTLYDNRNRVQAVYRIVSSNDG